MPKLNTAFVSCPQCNKKQEDRGKRSTCAYCGCSPLPSYSYPASSGFHPKFKSVQEPEVKPRPYIRRTPTPRLPL